MALSASTVIEVRGATGNDTNGGGFVTGASGTDYSQQGAKNTSTPDKSVTDGVTAGTTTITSATASFQTSIVGNIIFVSGGTGSIVGAWYQVTSRTNATTIVVDRSTGLTAGTGVTINIGGALATIQQALTLMSVAGMTGWVKADGVYSISTGLTVGAAGSTTVRTRVSGYTTTRGDGGQTTIKGTAAITMLTNSNSNWAFENFIFDGNAATATNGINHTNGQSSGSGNYVNIVLKNFSGYGFQAAANSSQIVIVLERCEITGCATTAGVNVNGAVLIMDRCYVHDNTVTGVVVGAGAAAVPGPLLISCIFDTNTGTTSMGVDTALHPQAVINCIFYKNDNSGMRVSQAAGRIQAIIQNNMFVNNGVVAGFGLNFSTGGSSSFVIATLRNNYYALNQAGPVNGAVVDSTSIQLNDNPFVDGDNGDFRLNTTTAGGLACRASGSVGSVPGLATPVGYEDIGTFQHQDTPPIFGRRGGLSLLGR